MSLFLKNGNIFNSITGQTIENTDILIENGKISELGNNLSSPEDVKIVDLTGKFVLPGLIDCHVHLSATTAVDFAKEMFRHKSAWYSYIGLKHGQDHLKAGFTTLRDCGDWLGNYGATLKRVWDQGLFNGPRLLVAQKTIGQWGNQEAMGPPEMIELGKKEEVMAGRDGVIHAVRERKRSGSDFVKTMTTGGVLHGMESQLDRSLWTDEELSAMVSEVKRLGMHLAVHAHGLHGIKKAAIAGVDTIEHCSFVDEESAKIMKKNNVYLVPTQTSAFMDKPKLMEQLDPEVRTKTIAVDTAMFENHKMAFERGVILALGTDAGVPGNPHGESAREITCMVENVEMTPEQAIQTATINAARAIKLEHLIGSLEVGKAGDVVITSLNPFEDITILETAKNIEYVIKDGKIMAQNGNLVNI